jgi:hypothetical protein
MQTVVLRHSSRHLLNLINHLRVDYGREDSFKLVPGQVLADRILIGLTGTAIQPDEFFGIAFELGMPRDCEPLLAPRMPQANTVFFGVEDREGGSVRKMYLEFWDEVRAEVRRTGSLAPQLIHLGVKWDTARPGHHELARYICHPMLSVRDVLRRMAAVYEGHPAPATREEALSIVRQGIKRNPDSSILYIEVGEEGNPRRSFDVNLYKTGISVNDAAPQLYAIAQQLGIEQDALRVQMERLGELPLGHLSGGVDRHGREFLSVYAEVRAANAADSLAATSTIR